MVKSLSSSSSSIVDRINQANSKIQKLFNQISAGQRITSASDDAAGLAIADALKADQVTLSQANRNIYDGVSQLSIAEGAAGEISNVVDRMRELQIQASNGVLNDDQRGALNEEFQQLKQEIDRTVATTTFNGKQLLSNNASTDIQVGTGSSPDDVISISNADLDTSNLQSLDISTQAGAQGAGDALTDFASSASQLRGNIGAVESRLQVAESSNEAKIEGAAAAESRIRDLDIAQALADLTRNNILQDTATAVLAQANQQPQKVLTLLK